MDPTKDTHIMDENLEAVYSALYRPCLACYGKIYDDDDPSTAESVRRRLDETHPLPTELVGWVTSPEKVFGVDCDYCLRVLRGE